MIIEFNLFFFLTLLLIINTVMVILSQNSIYSVLFLVLSFLITSCLLFLLECEFLALLFLIIYIGAISILFLFVVMMLNIKVLNSTKDIIKYFPIGNIIGGVFLFEVVSTLLSSSFFNNSCNKPVFTNFYVNWFEKIDFLTNVESLGHVLYSFHVIQFLTAGLILLVAVIGAVVLTVHNYQGLTKKQNIFRQISRNFKKTIKKKKCLFKIITVVF